MSLLVRGMFASVFRNFIGTREVLKLLKTSRVTQKSRNALASSYDCFIFIYSKKSLHRFVSMATSVLHTIISFALYNLFMHSSLTNQKRVILLSI